MQTSDTQKQESKSAYRHAAEAGVPMGLWLSAISLSLIFSLRLPELSIAMLPLMAGIPLLLFWLLRRIARSDASMARLSALWVAGIYTFIFGSVIAIFVSSVCTMLFEPSFVARYLRDMVETMQSSPLAPQYARQIEVIDTAFAAHAVPSDMQFFISMGWATCFAGSILSLAAAWILSLSSRRLRASGS